MNRLLSIILASFLMSIHIQIVEAVEPNPLEKPGWKLTFNDEFDSPLLDDYYWYAAYKSGRTEYQSQRAAYEAGKIDEYVKQIGTTSLYHNPNALYKIENGLLKLMIDETAPPRLEKTDAAVSCIQTSDFRFTNKEKTEYQVLEKFAQKYGWFETRCKSIKGTGLYTAFWLYVTDPTDQEFTPEGKRKPNNNGSVVEIDIFELLGQEAAVGNSQLNVHFPKEGGHYKYKMGFDPSEDFHIYAMEWEEGEINWYIDDKKVQTYKGDTPQKKMFILLALFHGMHTGWVGEVAENQTYPVVFDVDYVRVYEKE